MTKSNGYQLKIHANIIEYFSTPCAPSSGSKRGRKSYIIQRKTHWQQTLKEVTFSPILVRASKLRANLGELLMDLCKAELPSMFALGIILPRTANFEVSIAALMMPKPAASFVSN